MKKIKFLTSILVVVALILSTGCGKDSDTQSTNEADAVITKNETPSEPETKTPEEHLLRLGAMDDFKSSSEGASLIFDSLTKQDYDYNPQPNLIEEWKINDDFTEFELKIKENVAFQDGKIFTAEIAKWDIDNVGALSYCGYVNVIDQVDVIDDLTLKVSFKEPYRAFLTELARIKAYDIDGIKEDYSLRDYNGTGPFILEEYNADQDALLVKNANYWNKESIPKIEKVKWIVIPDDQARSMALSSDQVDVLGVTEHYTALSFSSMSSLMENDKVAVENQLPEGYAAPTALAFNWKNGFLNDKALRQAIAYGIDRATLVEKIFYGIPVSEEQMLGSIFIDGPKNKEPFSYDIEKAKKILEDGKYVLKDGQLLFNNEPVELLFITSDSHEFKDLAVFVQSELKKLGITVNVKASDYATKREILMSGQYDISIQWPWFEPITDSLAYYGVSDEYGPEGLGGMIDSKIQTLASELKSALTPEEIMKISSEIWDIQYAESVTVPLYSTPRFIFHNKKYQGYYLDGNSLQIDLSKVEFVHE